VKKYEKVSDKEPLGTLNSSVTALGDSMTKLGVKPPFAYGVAKAPATAPKPAPKRVAAPAPATAPKIETPAQAKQYTADVQNFAKKHPDKVDAFKLAEFFTPAQQEIDAGSFAKKGSNFEKLTAVMSQNKAFTAYRSTQSKARAAKMAEQKKLALKKINDGIKSMKSTVAKNPLAPNAFGMMKLVKKYEKVSDKEPLGTLESSVTALGDSMTKLGVKPPFAHTVAKAPVTAPKPAPKRAAAKVPQPKAQNTQVAAPVTAKPAAPAPRAQSVSKTVPKSKSVDLCHRRTKHSHVAVSGKCSNAYAAGDYTNVLKKWEPLAKGGNASAQFNLGQMYRRGQGVKKNDKTAVKWYTIAAEQGQAIAQNNLANRYVRGQGVEPNIKAALKWYKRAADQGYVSAMNNMARLYRVGQYVPKDMAEATKWYLLAAEQNSPTAEFYLGVNAKDDATKLKWLRLSVKHGGGKNSKEQLAKAEKIVARKAATKEGNKPENLLLDYYYTYMIVEACDEVRTKHLVKYLDGEELAEAKTSMTKIENYYKSLETKMNTDAIWDKAGQLFDKKEAPHFKRFKMQDDYNDKLKNICRKMLFSVTSFRVPGEKKKKRKKRFGTSTPAPVARKKSFSTSAPAGGATTDQNGLPASAAKYSKPGTTRAVDIRLRGRKTAGNCYCLKARVQNNALDVVQLNALKGQEIKDADGAAAEFALFDCGVDRNPQLDPNLKLPRGEVASGWMCWKLPSPNYTPVSFELKGFAGPRYGKLSLAENNFGASLMAGGKTKPRASTSRKRQARTSTGARKNSGRAKAVDVRITEKKSAGTCYCLKTRIQNNRLDMVKLNAFGSQKIKDADGAEAKFALMDCGLKRNPQLDPNLNLPKGEVASGWSCWQLPSQNYTPVTLELKAFAGPQYAKIPIE
ncbi:MAG: sel1 repeat family protein, partial [Rhodospirillaceae bacterium]|nr:sel1 repeat family protein [Rhodospirillaceae bacterium]